MPKWMAEFLNKSQVVSLKLLELTQFAWPNLSIYFNFLFAVLRDEAIYRVLVFWWGHLLFIPPWTVRCRPDWGAKPFNILGIPQMKARKWLVCHPQIIHMLKIVRWACCFCFVTYLMIIRVYRPWIIFNFWYTQALHCIVMMTVLDCCRQTIVFSGFTKCIVRRFRV